MEEGRSTGHRQTRNTALLAGQTHNNKWTTPKPNHSHSQYTQSAQVITTTRYIDGQRTGAAREQRTLITHTHTHNTKTTPALGRARSALALRCVRRACLQPGIDASHPPATTLQHACTHQQTDGPTF